MSSSKENLFYQTLPLLVQTGKSYSHTAPKDNIMILQLTWTPFISRIPSKSFNIRKKKLLLFFPTCAPVTNQKKKNKKTAKVFALPNSYFSLK